MGEFMTNTTETLARFVVEAKYEGLPREVVDLAKLYTLNCIGHMLAGINERASRIVVQHVREGGGTPQAGVVGAGFRTSLANAVLANGTTAHAVELESLGKHAGSVLIPPIVTALSAGEAFGASGRAVLEALIVGSEVQARVGLGCPGGPDAGFMGISLTGPIGAATVVAKLLAFDVDTVRNAFGLALPQAGGSYRSCGYMAHVWEAGLPCRNGVTAALLAREGFTADPDFLDGPRSFGDQYCSGKRGYHPEFITKDIGRPFYLVHPGSGVKKYGCCGFNHRAIEALAQLVSEYDLCYDDVETVEVGVYPFMLNLLRFPEPHTAEEAKFSLQQSLGGVLVDRKLPLPYLSAFTEEAATNPKYVEARQKVHVILRQEGTSERVMRGVPVTLRLKDGRTYVKTAESLHGELESPFTREEHIEAFSTCARATLSTSQIQRTIDMVLNIEGQGGLRELMDLLASISREG